MYNRNFWIDHVVDEQGEVVQLGTMMDQDHFNNMEHGIDDATLAAQFNEWARMQQSYDIIDELHTVTLGSTGVKWPCNNVASTVALDQLRENTDYAVDLDVLEYSGGRLGHIKVYDRAANGFKLLHDGSATSIKVNVRIHGGLIN